MTDDTTKQAPPAHAEIKTRWADGEHTFRLTIPGIIELEEKIGIGFGALFNRLEGYGDFHVEYVQQTLRIGLIGGGMSPVQALKLVERYCIPMAESLPIARALVGVVMFGNPPDEPKQDPAKPDPIAPATEAVATELSAILGDWDRGALRN